MFEFQLVDNESESTVSNERVSRASKVLMELSMKAEQVKDDLDLFDTALRLSTMKDEDFNKIAKLCGVD